MTFSDAQVETVSQVIGLTDSLEQLVQLIQSIDNQDENAQTGETVEQIILLAQQLFSDIQALSNVSGNDLAQLPSPLDQPDTWRELALRLPNYLLANWLRIHAQLIYSLLNFCGLMDLGSSENESEQPFDSVKWQDIGSFLTDPVSLIQSKYGWGGELDHTTFVANFLGLCYAVGFLPKSGPVRPDMVEAYYGNIQQSDPQEIEVPLHQGWILGGSTYFDLSLLFLPVPRTKNSSEITGLALTNILEGEANFLAEIDDDWSMSINASADVNGLIGLMIQPEGVSFTSQTPEANVGIKLIGEPEEPWILLGKPDKARLELARLTSELSVNGTINDPELQFSMSTLGSTPGLNLVIGPGDGDSFISEILGSNALTINSDIGFTWSSETGFRFEGGVGFEVEIPTNIRVGPIRVDLVRLGLYGGTEGAQVEAAITGGVDLNVLAVVVSDIGIRAIAVPMPQGDTSGLLGPLDLVFEFKPPNGLGLVIDGKGIVTGSGYIEHDENKGQYAGVAEISFLNLGLSAIGILTTRMPDGSEGWSLFLSIFSEFPAIQLGFGFTLNGVGGLVGINRTLDDEALRERLLQGAMDSIMFPEDPVANAPIIIADIEAVFPPAQDQFLFGVMMKFGWGTPSLLSIELGVMVELPDPIRIGLLGQLGAVIPNPQFAILELNMDIFGLADITAGTFVLDAVIRDSHIVELLTLSGDMAVRAQLTDQPTVLMSVGGFNPKFKPPAEFPRLRLMRASLPLGNIAAVDVSTYIAITSNTFQMGGRIDVWAKFAGFSAEGYIEMDALIQFTPFGFQFHAGFGVTVKAGRITLMGVDVSANFTGPGRWEIVGKATFEILKVKKKINLDIAVGQKKSNSAEKFNVRELLIAALSDVDNWNVVEDDETSGFIRLRERDDTEEMAVHPGGQLQVVQNIAPFNSDLEVFGNGKIEGDKRFELDQITVGGTAEAVSDSDYIDDWFAPAHFFKMKDNEKVSAPSFEKMDGGVKVGSDNIEQGSMNQLTVKYEEIYVDPELNQLRTVKKRKDAISDDLLTKFDRFSAAEIRRRGIPKLKNSQIKPQFKVIEPKYKIENIETGNIINNLTGGKKLTYAETQSIVRKKNNSTLQSLDKYEIVMVG